MDVVRLCDENESSRDSTGLFQHMVTSPVILYVGLLCFKHLVYAWVELELDSNLYFFYSEAFCKPQLATQNVDFFVATISSIAHWVGWLVHKPTSCCGFALVNMSIYFAYRFQSTRMMKIKSTRPNSSSVRLWIIIWRKRRRRRKKRRKMMKMCLK